MAPAPAGRPAGNPFDDVDRDMIAPRDVTVEKHAVQVRRFRLPDPPLLDQFAPQGLEKGFADLDAPSRQMPAGDIAVPDQKHPVVAIEHDAADADIMPRATRQ